MKTLSDYGERTFSPAYGVLIKELRLLARALFVVDARDTIRYVQLVRERNGVPHDVARSRSM